MKEHIDTIPVNEAFDSGDECPFCYLERMADQRAIRYVLGPGASYMEPDIREITNREGFCGAHYKKMYDFGNALGNALIMQTYLDGLLEELEKKQRVSTCRTSAPSSGQRKLPRQRTSPCSNGRRTGAAPATCARSWNSICTGISIPSSFC